jgi:hypothetical protein
MNLALLLLSILLAFPQKLTTSNPSQPAQMLRSERVLFEHGTLVVFVPTKDGLIVAADSRVTVTHDFYCDGCQKIYPLVNHPRSVIAVTGLGSFIANDTKITCEDLRQHHVRSVEFDMVGQTFLDAHKGDITEKIFNSLGTVIVSKFQTMSKAIPQPIQPGSEGAILAVRYGHYDEKKRVSILGSFSVCLNEAKNKFSVCFSRLEDLRTKRP